MHTRGREESLLRNPRILSSSRAPPTDMVSMMSKTTFHHFTTASCLNIDANLMESNAWPQGPILTFYIECEETGDTLFSREVQSKKEARILLAHYIDGTL